MTARARKPLRRRTRGEDRAQPLAARGAAHGQRTGAHRRRATDRGVLALRRALGKPHPRLAGVDDGAFARGDATAPIAAVVVSVPEHLEAAGTSRVTVDGQDATGRIVALLRSVAPPEGLRAVLLDGAVVGGFNVVDLDAVRRALRVPVVAVTRRRPDFARIRAALTKWFPRSADARWALLRAHRLFRVPTGGEPIWAACSGCTQEDAGWLVRRATVRGFWPEPVRLAHLVASAGRVGRPPRKANSIGRRRPRVRRGPVA